jgi:hypothetical protein
MLLWFWELAAGCVVTTPPVQVKLHAWMECNARDVCYHHNRTHLLTLILDCAFPVLDCQHLLAQHALDAQSLKHWRYHASAVPLEAAGVGPHS